MIYQWITLSGGSDQFGSVKYGDAHSWTGRLGARVTKDWTSETGKKATVWARANVWHSFDSDVRTTFTSTDGTNATGLKTKLGGTTGQVGLGIAGQLSPRLTAYASGDFNFAMDNGNGHSLGGRVGLRYEF